VYTAAEYDEFLLFKYLLIKAISHGKMYPVPFDATKMTEAAKSFRGMSNKLQFMSNEYNAYGVTTTTPKADQYIFMDAEFNAAYDVDVLASAFNMGKAEFSGKLKLIDDWTTFDNDRFNEIRAGSDQIEEVTDAELLLMADVKAVLIDKEWFQVYDNLNQMTEQNVASGIYWNYFYNVWKTVSSSPFSNAIVFVDDGATTTVPTDLTATVVTKSVGDLGTVITLDLEPASAALEPSNYAFVQTEDATEDGIAIHKYGALIFPPLEPDVELHVKIGEQEYISGTYDAGTTTYTKADFESDNADVGDTIKLYKAEVYE
jgi:hypothetical protein